jgi:predicted transcriptional regulator
MITGEIIKKMREEAHLTQQQLADEVDITQAHIARIENEKVNPTLSTINKIIAVLQKNKKMKCKELASQKLILIRPDNSINQAIKLMKENDISQIPVMNNGNCVGSINDKTIVRSMDRISGTTEVKEIMDEPFPVISCDDSVEVVKSLLEYHQAVLISDKGKIVGIITKSDLLSLLK